MYWVMVKYYVEPISTFMETVSYTVEADTPDEGVDKALELHFEHYPDCDEFVVEELKVF